MRLKLPILVLAGAAALIAGLAAGLIYQHRQGPNPLRVDFSLNDLNGQTQTAAAFDGQLVLLNFWAPWCAPCRAEIPMLNELQAEFGPAGLQILGPAVDQIDAIQDFITGTAIDYPVLVNLPAVMRLQDSYGEQRLPFSVLIDRSGKVIFRQAGELQKNQITPLIKQNL